MYIIKATRQFKTDFKKLSSDDQKLVQDIVNMLKNGKQLPPKYRDHSLKGNLKGLRDCHVKSDLVLIYDKDKKIRLIKLIRVGNHSTLQLSSLHRHFNDVSRLEQIDNLIEDIYNLRKEGMEEDGEYSIKNLIFKEFRNLGYLDNLKELRKKEISKDLSLEQLNEDISSIQKLSTEDITILCKIINELPYYEYYVVSALNILDDIRDTTEEIYSTIHSVVLKWKAEDFVTFCIWKRDKLEIFDFFSLYKNKNKYEADEYFFVKFDDLLDYLMVDAEGDIGEVYNIVTDTSMGEKSLDDYAKNLYKYDYKTRKFNNKSLYDEINSEITQHLKK